MMIRPPNFPDLSSSIYEMDKKILGGLTLQLKGLGGLASDTAAHLQRYCVVLVLMGQNGFDVTRETYTIVTLVWF